MFYTDIKPPDDGKFIPDPKKIVDDIFIKKVESYMKWQKLETATISDKGKDNQITDVRRSKIHWMDNPEFERVLVPIYKELSTKVREINNIYWRYAINGWEAFQYTEYDESYKGHYDWHSDVGPKRAFEDQARKISFSLGLNDAELEEYFLTGEDPRLKKEETIKPLSMKLPVPMPEKTTQDTKLISSANNMPIDTVDVSQEVVQTAALPDNINQDTGLTSMEEALLSNEEKALRRKQRNVTV